MRYMLLLLGTQPGRERLQESVGAESLAGTDVIQNLDRQLGASGELVSGGSLAGPELAKLVRARAGEAPAVTNGPLAPGEKFLARYWVVDCDCAEQAIQIAARVSALPGPDGVPLDAPVEVRALMRALGEEM